MILDKLILQCEHLLNEAIKIRSTSIYVNVQNNSDNITENMFDDLYKTLYDKYWNNKTILLSFTFVINGIIIDIYYSSFEVYNGEKIIYEKIIKRYNSLINELIDYMITSRKFKEFHADSVIDFNLILIKLNEILKQYCLCLKRNNNEWVVLELI